MKNKGASEALKKKWSENREGMIEAQHNSEKYKNCEGMHQLEDHEQWKNYMREYQRKWRKAHPEYYMNLQKGRRRAAKINKLKQELETLEQQ